MQAHFERLTGLLVSKTAEYGSADIEVMGSAVGQLVTPPPGLSPYELRIYTQEAAIAFHVASKTGRLFSAYKRGVVPGNDTWDDLTCYGAMGSKIRATGLWAVD